MKQRSNNPQRPEGTRIRNPHSIRASEIGDYSYCSRAWWYRHVAQIEPPDSAYSGRLAKGRRAHARHGRLVAASAVFRMVGLLLALCGLLALMAALFLIAPR